jgi:hypothetical protein
MGTMCPTRIESVFSEDTATCTFLTNDSNGPCTGGKLCRRPTRSGRSMAEMAWSKVSMMRQCSLRSATRIRFNDSTMSMSSRNPGALLLYTTNQSYPSILLPATVWPPVGQFHPQSCPAPQSMHSLTVNNFLYRWLHE